MRLARRKSKPQPSNSDKPPQSTTDDSNRYCQKEHERLAGREVISLTTRIYAHNIVHSTRSLIVLTEVIELALVQNPPLPSPFKFSSIVSGTPDLTREPHQYNNMVQRAHKFSYAASLQIQINTFDVRLILCTSITPVLIYAVASTLGTRSDVPAHLTARKVFGWDTVYLVALIVFSRLYAPPGGASRTAAVFARHEQRENGAPW